MSKQCSAGLNKRSSTSRVDVSPAAVRLPGLRGALALVMLLVMPVAAQSPGVPRVPNGHAAPDVSDSGMGIAARMEAKRVTQLNLIRQKSLIWDADRLLHLAQELNNDAAAGGTALSVAERMQKASEIQRLAKEVKEKMTYAVGAPLEVANPFVIDQR
jgi:hypothetical protein